MLAHIAKKGRSAVTVYIRYIGTVSHQAVVSVNGRVSKHRIVSGELIDGHGITFLSSRRA